MVGYSGYEISRHKKQVVKPFLSENTCYFTCQAQKITIYFLILGEIQDGGL